MATHVLHTPENQGIANFNNYQSSRFLIFNWTNTPCYSYGAVWDNSFIFLTHWMFGVTHLESAFQLWRNQVVDLHKQKLKTVPQLNFET